MKTRDDDGDDGMTVLIPIPEKGIDADKIRRIIESLKATETTAEEGKSFAYTYTTETYMPHLSVASEIAYRAYSESSGIGVSGRDELLQAVWTKFMNTNALNPMMYLFL